MFGLLGTGWLSVAAIVELVAGVWEGAAIVVVGVLVVRVGWEVVSLLVEG